MTKPEIERKLAELLEPKPTEPAISGRFTRPRGPWYGQEDGNWYPRPLDGAYAMELVKTYRASVVWIRTPDAQYWRSGIGFDTRAIADTPEEAIALAVIAELENRRTGKEPL